jgi:hypothetical protein
LRKELYQARLGTEQADDLERRRAAQRNQWRIARDCGEAISEKRMASDMVWLELTFACPDFLASMGVVAYVRQYFDSRNPHCIDAAVVLCAKAGIAPPPTLATLVAEVAKARMMDRVGPGTAAQIRRANAKGFALDMMASLCAAGATVEAAASKVARHVATIGGGVRFKASTLEKEYASRGREQEHWRRQEFLSEDGREKLAGWKQLIAELPEADDDLKGWRR